MPGSKSDLMNCFEECNTDIPAENNISIDCIVLDGAAIVNMITPTGVTTFQQYADEKFTPFIRRKLQNIKRIDIVWDVYIKNSLKSSARQKRGNNQHLNVFNVKFKFSLC